MMELLIAEVPILSAWLGLIGWLFVKIGTSNSRIIILGFILISLFFVAAICSWIWPPREFYGHSFQEALANFTFLMMATLFFTFGMSAIAGDDLSTRRRATVEYVSVITALGGLVIDSYLRMHEPYYEWWCKALHNHGRAQLLLH